MSFIVSYLIDRFGSGNVSPRFPVTSSEVDNVLEHEPDAAAPVLVVTQLLDLAEVIVERSQTLRKFCNIFIG
jgi:pyoverdine/dityrosine biosynthesis protein Dit1